MTQQFHFDFLCNYYYINLSITVAHLQITVFYARLSFL